jgi:hypothetical protein
VEGLCLALDLAALKALAVTLEPADVPLEVCAAALNAALEATGGGSLLDPPMSWAQRQAQEAMVAAHAQEVVAAEAAERQAAVAAAKLLREERDAAAAADKLIRLERRRVERQAEAERQRVEQVGTPPPPSACASPWPSRGGRA